MVIGTDGEILVFPAGAGVIPRNAFNTVILFCFPRRCGGDPHVYHSLQKLMVFPAGAGVIPPYQVN